MVSGSAVNSQHGLGCRLGAIGGRDRRPLTQCQRGRVPIELPVADREASEIIREATQGGDSGDCRIRSRLTQHRMRQSHTASLDIGDGRLTAERVANVVERSRADAGLSAKPIETDGERWVSSISFDDVPDFQAQFFDRCPHICSPNFYETSMKRGRLVNWAGPPEPKLNQLALRESVTSPRACAIANAAGIPPGSEISRWNLPRWSASERGFFLVAPHPSASC